MTLDKLEELAYLIGLRLAVHFLDVNQLRYVGMAEDMMTATHSRHPKAKSFHEVLQISEGDVARTSEKSAKQPPSFHAFPIGASSAGAPERRPSRR
jgi:hypothetical protein